MEKFCLKWNEFEANIRESFKTLREEERLFDVTLATEDGQHIQAHKMVLSAGSNFFRDILYYGEFPSMLQWIVTVLISVTSLLIGVFVFRRLEPGFVSNY